MRGTRNEMNVTYKTDDVKAVRTPIYDFVREYAKSGVTRFHMPGHKGKRIFGPEKYDITEIKGADSLYEAKGIIAESENTASRLFGSGATFYSTEGSSQCIKAMMYLLTESSRPVILAARNVHKAFLHAAMLLDFDVIWIVPKDGSKGLLSQTPSPDDVREAFARAPSKVAALYLTSPDYLGKTADISEIADICHDYGAFLAVDNAHGAYLHFLTTPVHPLDLGADVCCDSAHKTLPVLTGGAYLHIAKKAPYTWRSSAKRALEIFGSTSPSYLILASLDLCNKYLAGDCERRLEGFLKMKEKYVSQISRMGWDVRDGDPLRLVIKHHMQEEELIYILHSFGIECEHTDRDYAVFMMTPENTADDMKKLVSALDAALKVRKKRERSDNTGCFPGDDEKDMDEGAEVFSGLRAKRVMSFREAFVSEGEVIPAASAIGRICRLPVASCPPAVPVVMPGEMIDRDVIKALLYYDIGTVDVVKRPR